MLFRAPVVIAALFATSALATWCPAGTYKKVTGNTYQCITCSEGYYTSTQNMASSCSKCPAGQTSKPDHKGCINCTGQTYSLGGTACMLCPAGKEMVNNHKGCDDCCTGKYNNTPGGTCQECPLGTFSNVSGAKECCTCCAGWYADTLGSKSCKQCPNSKKYGPVGSTSGNYCKSNKGSLPNYTTSCGINGKICPPTTPGGPQGSPIARKRSDAACTNGLTSCPHYAGAGGFECVDTQSDAESCGGCLGVEGEGSGTDCTAAEGVNVTRCVKGSCVVDSCRKGWAKSIDGASCVPGSDSLHAQEAKIKRSAGKRGIRHTMF